MMKLYKYKKNGNGVSASREYLLLKRGRKWEFPQFPPVETE